METTEQAIAALGIGGIAVVVRLYMDGELDLDALDDLAAGRALRTLLINERTDHGDQR